MTLAEDMIRTMNKNTVYSEDMFQSTKLDTVPLTTITDEAIYTSNDILIKILRLDAHLFGNQDPINESDEKPWCYRAALEKHLKTLKYANDRLTILLKEVGADM